MRATASTRALVVALVVVLLTLGGALPTTAASRATTAPSPVTGVDVHEDDQPPADLPDLSPGLHSDELTSSEETWRAYRIRRTQPGSTLHVSMTVRPPIPDETSAERLDLTVLAPDGTECVSESESSSHGQHNGVTTFMTVTGRLVGEDPEEDSDEQSCTATGDFTVLVQREGEATTLPTELQVIDEPKVADLAGLPEAVEDYPEEVDLPQGEETPVSGGDSFTDAAEITEGTWSDTLEPGDTRVYRVRVEDGQTARFTTHGPTGGFRYPTGGSSALWVDGRAYAPDRQLLGSGTGSVGRFSASSKNPSSVTAAPVRFTNRFAGSSPSNLTASSIGGWHYYTVGVGTEDLGEDLAGEEITVAFTVQVEGAPSTDVEYDAPEGGDGAPASGDSEESRLTPLLLWGGLGLAGILVLTVMGYLVARLLRA